jgi:hypothetical protein
MTSVRAGLQRAYLEGLDFLRNKIQDSEQEVQSLQRTFYCMEDEKGDNLTQKQLDYLKQVNEKLLLLNSKYTVRVTAFYLYLQSNRVK